MLRQRRLRKTMEDVFGAPYSSNETAVWQSEPTTRGTFTILSTSLITLVLCVWSSIHLNLPGFGPIPLSAFVRRLQWIAIGLFMPEVLVTTARGQYHLAKRISMEAHRTFQDKTEDEESRGHRPRPRKHAWTMTHSYWAIMGGIAADTTGHERFLPAGSLPLFTSSGVSMLLRYEPDLIPDISEDDIKDKSKGGSVAKFLACIQATWFCASCIGRIAQRLPLSQFELCTFAHALCTVIVHILWWKKPLDVATPHKITSSRVRPLVAYAWMASKTSAIPKPKTAGRFSGNQEYSVGRGSEFEAIALKPTALASHQARGYSYINRRQRFTTNPDPTEPKVKVTADICLPGTSFYVNYDSTRWRYSVTTSSGSDKTTTVYTSHGREPAEFHLAPPPM